MTERTLTVPQLENFYDALAEAVDLATPEKSELFLAKLALLLARQVGDPAALEGAIRTALHDL